MPNRIISSFVFILLSVQAASAAIYGEDNRAQAIDSVRGRTLARSTAIAVLSANIEETQPGRFRLDTDALGESMCREEKFRSDPSLSYACSGFLVAPDLIATAGHCMVNIGENRNDTDVYCPTFSWLFDYQTDANGKTQVDDIPPDRHYRCKQVVYAIREEKPPFRDFALVQLERPVTDRKPLKLVPGSIAPDEIFAVLGYPLGAPAKLSDEAKLLLDDRSRQSFITSLDVFEGNSGSPVLNSRDEVVGILIGGSPISHFVKDKKRGCQRYNRCDATGTKCLQSDGWAKDDLPGYQRPGAEVQRIAPLIDLISEFQKSRAN